MRMMFFDVETGGLDEQKHSLLQVGLVAYQDGQILGTYESYLRLPEYHVQAEAMEVNKLDIREVFENGKRPVHVVDEVIAFTKKMFPFAELRRDVILAGHNLFLDRKMMMKLFADEGKDFMEFFSHRTIDTMSLLYGLVAAGKLPDSVLSLWGAIQYFNIPQVEEHRAVSDSLVTIKVFEECVALMK